MSRAEENEAADPRNSERTRGALLVFSWQMVNSIEVCKENGKRKVSRRRSEEGKERRLTNGVHSVTKSGDESEIGNGEQSEVLVSVDSLMAEKRGRGEGESASKGGFDEVNVLTSDERE